MKLILLVVAGLLAFSGVQARKCRALALSGGGDKGAYEAAVYVGLVNVLPPEEVAYDVVVGVSAGSLNTLGLSAYNRLDVVGASDFIFALWNSIPNYKAFGMWPGGVLDGIFFRKGIFDIKPGIKWVSENFGDKTVKRKVSFATVDANAADYVVYDYNATYTQPSDIIQSAFASSTMPAVFSQVIRDGKSLIDGGVIWNLDVPSAVRRCKEIVDDEKDIIIDLVLCGDSKIKNVDSFHKYSTLDHLFRGMEIKSFYNGMNDYTSSVVMYPDVEFRYLIAPSENLSSGFLPLDFSQSQIDKCFSVGKKDAATAVKLGSGGYAKVLIDYVERTRNGEKVFLEDMIQEAVAKVDNNANIQSQ